MAYLGLEDSRCCVGLKERWLRTWGKRDYPDGAEVPTPRYPALCRASTRFIHLVADELLTDLEELFE